ncbi:hypothetical protein Y1Q_0006088 [Alligator mississippiensis]|uniref:Uncharacterized protein n=1 Tax=Alligator mississippiensis TaxID=8496 RepID=A0A151N4G3_ALLMI|nr:hypothetical protein Y1Q_0006088 [Alligator mississippiensis]
MSLCSEGTAALNFHRRAPRSPARQRFQGTRQGAKQEQRPAFPMMPSQSEAPCSLSFGSLPPLRTGDHDGEIEARPGWIRSQRVLL